MRYLISILLILTAPVWANTAPEITSSAVTAVDEGTLYTYLIEASDEDNDTLSWSSSNLPSWLSLTSGGDDTIDTVAGTLGSGGSTGDDGNATDATLEYPMGVAVDGAGNIYIADYDNHTVRKVDSATGIITTVAGIMGESGSSGDNGAASEAQLNNPFDVVVADDGSIYIAESANHAIRKVDAATGIITTVAGTLATLGSSGDGGLATDALLNSPKAIALDSQGNLYIVDSQNQVVRKVDAATGIITTVAGILGSSGHSGDGILATSAKLYFPEGIAIDSEDNIYIDDTYNYAIRKVDASTGIITTVAGTLNSSGSSGDGGLATDATLNVPYGIALDSNNNLYIADSYNQAIRKVSATTGIIETLAGTFGTSGTSGDGGLATDAKLLNPGDVAIGSDGSLYIADTNNHAIRKVDTVFTLLAGTPGNDDVGTHDVNLSVSDANTSVAYNFQITVSNVNDAPTITSSAVTTVDEDSSYNYIFDASDVDGDTLTWSVTEGTSLPSWLSLTPQSYWEDISAAQFTIDGSEQTDIAIDSHGTPYISYIDYTNIDAATVMKYIESNASWVQVGAAEFTGASTDDIRLAIDSSDTPYVVFSDDSEGYKASVMKYVESNNSWEFVGGAGFSAGKVYDPSIAFDSNDTPYVAYQDYANGSKLTVMSFNGSEWVVVGSAAFSDDIMRYPDIKLDANDIPYVAFAQGISYIANVMKYEDNNWTTVGSSNFSAGKVYDVRLVFDSANSPYVVYRDVVNDNKATVMRYDGSDWSALGGAGFSGATAYTTEMVFDSQDTPYVVFADGANDDKTTVMKFDGSSWVNVGEAGFSAGYVDNTAIAIDGNDTIYVVYLDSEVDDDPAVMRLISSGLGGTPGDDDVGVFDINLTLSDGEANVTQNFQITVSNTPDAPTDITLIGDSILENNTIDDLVGSFSASDADADDTLTFSLTCNDTLFSIDGTALRINFVADYETQNGYIICVRVTDSDGLSYDENFVISIEDDIDTDEDGIEDSLDDDDDGDGMSDTFELEYGLNPFDPTDADGDLDSDGFTNLEEYKAGTEPDNDESKPSTGINPGIIMYLLN